MVFNVQNLNISIPDDVLEAYKASEGYSADTKLDEKWLVPTAEMAFFDEFDNICRNHSAEEIGKEITDFIKRDAAENNRLGGAVFK